MLSIVIPTTRDIYLVAKSLYDNSCKDFEILAQRQDGLVNARNLGWNRANSGIVAFIDDDVKLDRNWVGQILSSFDNPEVGCVIGRVITETGNRDNDWSNPIMKKFFKKLDVEACNMAFRKSVLEFVGGFDEVYSKGVGEWSEPDLVFKVKKFGFKVVHNDNAVLYHYPSKKGIYQERGEHSYWRMKNFITFRKRWLKWDLNLICVFIIFNIYWIYKFIRTGNKNWLGGLLASLR